MLNHLNRFIYLLYIDVWIELVVNGGEIFMMIPYNFNLQVLLIVIDLDFSRKDLF